MAKDKISATDVAGGHPKRESNLKPLQPPPTEGFSGYWGYAGKPLTDLDVKNLRAKGCIFAAHPDGDLMPDGKRLKHPRFRLRRPKESIIEPSLSHKQLRRIEAKLEEEYRSLPEPRPDFFEWAAERERPELYNQLRSIAFRSKRPDHRLKAINTMLEFSKSRPKQVHEVSGVADEPELTAEELLRLALEANGIDAEEFNEAMGKNPKKIVN